MSSIQNSIKIFARLKPTSHKPIDYEVSHRDCLETDEVLNFSLKGLYEDGYINNKQENYSYRFTQIFDRHCIQSQIFEDVAKPVIDSALEGYNGTVFVYGQTGSGKTFTMTGSRETYNDRGVIPRTLQYVFERFRQENSDNRMHNAFISYLEIYNEGGYDLLHSGDDVLPTRLEELAKVTLMEDGNQHMHLRNLTVHPVNSEEEALHLLYLGDRNRTVAETPLNEASTRSHCIFTVHINLRSTTSSMVRRSKIHLVDLAGSERIANSNISGQLLCEARHINLALHYLEQVIVALGDSKRSHIPYRNSMMTSILRDSLGGNCMTSMIATLSIEPKNVQETLSTCRFSQRVALVTNAATRNEELDPQLMIHSLKQEIKRLKELLMASTIKPITDTTKALTEEEYSNLICLLDQFLSDSDPNSVLAIEPDMRIIQACFQILKATITDDNNGSSKPLTPGPLIQHPMEISNETYGFEELSQTIKDRDSEIKELVEMLNQERLKNPHSEIIEMRGSRGTAIPDGDFDPFFAKDEDEMLDNFKPVEFECEKMKSLKLTSVSDAEEQIFKERNVSTSMRKELDCYLNDHHDKDSIGQMRKTLADKLEEVENIENELNKNKLTMMSLKDILKNSKNHSMEGLNHVDYTDLEKALLSQQRAIELQENRLIRTQEQMTESVDSLKAMYDKLLMDYEFDRKGQVNKLTVSKEETKTAFSEAVEMFKKSQKEVGGYGYESTKQVKGASSTDSFESEFTTESDQTETDVHTLPSTEAIVLEAEDKTATIIGEQTSALDKTFGMQTPRELPSQSRINGYSHYPEEPPFVDHFQSRGDSCQTVYSGDPDVDAEINNFLEMRRRVISRINSRSQNNIQSPPCDNRIMETFK